MVITLVLVIPIGLNFKIPNILGGSSAYEDGPFKASGVEAASELRETNLSSAFVLLDSI